MRRNSLVALALLAVLATLLVHARAAEEAADPIVQRTADVRSEGVRLTAKLYFLASLQGKRLPTIIYVVIPGIAHYGIYGEAREQATQLAIDWYDQPLKP